MTQDTPAACYGMGCPFRGDCQLFAELGTSEGAPR